jgi:hypothetical protein
MTNYKKFLGTDRASCVFWQGLHVASPSQQSGRIWVTSGDKAESTIRSSG